jgi:hypothetical protein
MNCLRDLRADGVGFGVRFNPKGAGIYARDFRIQGQPRGIALLGKMLNEQTRQLLFDGIGN